MKKTEYKKEFNTMYQKMVLIKLKLSYLQFPNVLRCVGISIHKVPKTSTVRPTQQPLPFAD